MAEVTWCALVLVKCHRADYITFEVIEYLRVQEETAARRSHAESRHWTPADERDSSRDCLFDYGRRASARHSEAVDSGGWKTGRLTASQDTRNANSEDNPKPSAHV
jgi:hypothetical protein